MFSKWLKLVLLVILSASLLLPAQYAWGSTKQLVWSSDISGPVIDFQTRGDVDDIRAELEKAKAELSKTKAELEKATSALREMEKKFGDLQRKLSETVAERDRLALLLSSTDKALPPFLRVTDAEQIPERVLLLTYIGYALFGLVLVLTYLTYFFQRSLREARLP